MNLFCKINVSLVPCGFWMFWSMKTSLSSLTFWRKTWFLIILEQNRILWSLRVGIIKAHLNEIGICSIKILSFTADWVLFLFLPSFFCFTSSQCFTHKKYEHCNKSLIIIKLQKNLYEHFFIQFYDASFFCFMVKSLLISLAKFLTSDYNVLWRLKTDSSFFFFDNNN
jgi:hypothetical protein